MLHEDMMPCQCTESWLPLLEGVGLTGSSLGEEGGWQNPGLKEKCGDVLSGKSSFFSKGTAIWF